MTAESKEVAEQWAKNRLGNILLSDPSDWEVSEVREEDDDVAESYHQVFADGTHAYLPEPAENSE